MISRVIACGAIACCLIVGAAAASVDRAGAELFKGKTGQGYRIKAQVKGQAFRIHVFDIDLRCRDGSELALIEGGFLWTKVGKRGGFRDAQFGRTDSVYFRGRLTERRLSGRVRVTDRLGDGTRCASNWTKFNATPR
jgi:hypothetical protein